MKNETFEKDIMDMMAMLDEEEYPEVYDLLSAAIHPDSEEKFDAYELASRIMLADRPKDLPSYLIDFVEQLYRLSFEEGKADALNDLGAQYYDGARGFEQSFKKAVACYQVAAEHGSREAQENLGYCYYYGRNMPVDYKKAFHYFALGAFDGHITSLYKIGDMYAAGYYVKQNQEEAFRIYSRCLDIMTDEVAGRCAGPVYFRIGKMLLNGSGCKKDPETALECYQKAEVYFYDMVKSGDYMYKKSWLDSIEGQVKAREAMVEKIPGKDWPFDR